MSTAPSTSPNDDKTTRWAFYFLLSTLGIALLAALWVLVQTALG